VNSTAVGETTFLTAVYGRLIAFSVQALEQDEGMEQMGFDQLLLTILMWEPKQKMAFSCILLLVGSFLLRRWMILATVIDVCAPA